MILNPTSKVGQDKKPVVGETPKAPAQASPPAAPKPTPTEPNSRLSSENLADSFLALDSVADPVDEEPVEDELITDDGTVVQKHTVAWVFLDLMIVVSMVLTLVTGVGISRGKAKQVSLSAASSLSQYGAVLKTGNLLTAGMMVNPKGFLVQENKYSSSVKKNQDVLALKRKLLQSVSYSYDQSKGSGIMNRNKTYLPDFTKGVPITRSFFDWSKVNIDNDTLQKLVSSENLNKDDPDYSLKISTMFAKYLLANIDNTDVKSVTTTSSAMFVFNSDSATINPTEDKYLDRALYSNDYIDALFKDFQDKTWTIVGGQGGTPKGRWLVPELNWMGAYKLSGGKEGTASVANPDSGKTKANPAGIGTPVQTTFPDSKGKDQPISVTLVKFMEGSDAIKWYESKDTRNTGYDPTSDLTQVGYIFNVVNLSTVPLTIPDDSSLVDNMGNRIVRVGTLFGMRDTVTLQPGDSAQVESWSDSTAIDKLFLVWGKGYLTSERDKVVYFNVLGANSGNSSK